MPTLVRMPAQHDAKAETQRQAALDSYGILDTAPEQAFDDIVQLARVVCDVPVATVALIDRDRQWFMASDGLAMTQTPRSEAICGVAIDGQHDPRDLFEVRDVLADARIAARPIDADGRSLRFYAGMPLLSRNGYAIGMVCVLDHLPRTLDERQRQALRALARQTQHLLELRRHVRQQGALLRQRTAAAQQFENERADLQRRHDDLKYEVRHDPLTGLLNRHALEKLRTSPEALQRLGTEAYALALIDIDHFKQINDRHGHLLGDRALRAAARAISNGIRQDDLAARYGGEEFLLVLPSTGLPGARDVAERIRVAMTQLALPFSLTVSIGIAAGVPRRDAPEKVFKRADQALYRAKSGGRNCVVADETLLL
ncbi:MAG: diguanylate cyclase [Luteimonas sp.]